MDIHPSGEVIHFRHISAPPHRIALNEIGLKANPEDVEPVVTQPKKSEKVFYLTAIRVNGAEYPVEQRIVYEDPETLGKRKCEDTKRQLPGVLFAGLFDPSRDKDFFRRHTELYPLDADHVADPASLRCRVSKHPSVFAAFLSATGSGLRILVRGPRVTDKDDYDDVYMRILRTLGMEWGISDKLDATRDCSRLSFLSYDPDLYINWDAVPLALDDLSEPEPEPEQAKANAKGKASETNERKPKPEPKPAGLGAPLAIDWGEAGGIPDAIWEDISLKKCCDALC